MVNGLGVLVPSIIRRVELDTGRVSDLESGCVYPRGFVFPDARSSETPKFVASWSEAFLPTNLGGRCGEPSVARLGRFGTSAPKTDLSSKHRGTGPMFFRECSALTLIDDRTALVYGGVGTWYVVDLETGNRVIVARG